MFEYIYEKICRWRLQQSHKDPTFRATYPKNGTMYILASHPDGTMDTQMSQESFGLEHHDRGNLVAVLQQPFTSQETLRKDKKKKQVLETINTMAKFGDDINFTALSTEEEEELTNEANSNDDCKERGVVHTVDTQEKSDWSLNAPAVQQSIKSSTKMVHENDTFRRCDPQKKGAPTGT